MTFLVRPHGSDVQGAERRSQDGAALRQHMHSVQVRSQVGDVQDSDPCGSRKPALNIGGKFISRCQKALAWSLGGSKADLLGLKAAAWAVLSGSCRYLRTSQLIRGPPHLLVSFRAVNA
jgi:hypothetical protein